MVAGERFEAWCTCPACERFACHHLRAATVADNCLRTRTEALLRVKHRLRYAREDDQERAYITAFGTQMLRTLYVNTPGWSDEARYRQAEFKSRTETALFDVVRTCECGNSWGQT